MPDGTNPNTSPADHASDSGWPRRSKHFQQEPGGFYASHRVWGAIAGVIMAILTGGATYSGWQLVTQKQLDESINEAKAEQAVVNEEVSSALTTQGETIVVVSATVKRVQEVQHLDIAQREARRVVDEAIQCRRYDNGCRDRRDREIERIRRLNTERLGAKREEDRKPPCADLACN